MDTVGATEGPMISGNVERSTSNAERRTADLRALCAHGGYECADCGLVPVTDGPRGRFVCERCGGPVLVIEPVPGYREQRKGAAA